MSACPESASVVASQLGENTSTVKFTCLNHGIKESVRRCWYTYTPDKAAAAAAKSDAVPLVVELHGFGSCTEDLLKYTGWSSKARSDGFIIAWPQGRYDIQGFGEGKPSWNAGGCCGAAPIVNEDDVGFLRRVVEEVASNNSGVDRNRVYFAGHSNGCMMAQRMAVEASSVVAAVACHSGFLTPTKQRPFVTDGYVPTPVMEVHGTSDPVVKYDGGRFGLVQYNGAEQNLREWGTRNQCADELRKVACEGGGSSSNGCEVQSYGGCFRGTSVAHVKLDDVGHWPFKGSSGLAIDTTQLAWDFVKQFTLSPQSSPSLASPSSSPSPPLSPPVPVFSTTNPGPVTIHSGAPLSPVMFPLFVVSILVARTFGFVR